MTNDEYTPDLEQDENKNQEGQDENQNPNQNEPKSDDEGKDWKAEALKYKAILDRNKNKPKEEPKKAPADDYGFKAYLALNGVKNAKEVELVKQYMSDTGKSAEQIISSKFFQAELSELQEIAKTENASPDGRKASNNSLDSVEYWMTKPMEEVPKDMRSKVINKRMEQENSKGVFYNS